MRLLAVAAILAGVYRLKVYVILTAALETVAALKAIFIIQECR